MFKVALFLSVGLAASRGGTIDSGPVFTSPYTVSDSTTVFLGNLSSTDGNFSIFGSGILGGANLNCTFS